MGGRRLSPRAGQTNEHKCRVASEDLRRNRWDRLCCGCSSHYSCLRADHRWLRERRWWKTSSVYLTQESFEVVHLSRFADKVLLILKWEPLFSQVLKYIFFQPWLRLLKLLYRHDSHFNVLGLFFLLYSDLILRFRLFRYSTHLYRWTQTLLVVPTIDSSCLSNFVFKIFSVEQLSLLNELWLHIQRRVCPLVFNGLWLHIPSGVYPSWLSPHSQQIVGHSPVWLPERCCYYCSRQNVLHTDQFCFYLCPLVLLYYLPLLNPRE